LSSTNVTLTEVMWKTIPNRLVGAAERKLRLPTVFVFVGGTTRSTRRAERSLASPASVSTGMHTSVKNAGHAPRTNLNAIDAVLYVTLCRTGNHGNQLSGHVELAWYASSNGHRSPNGQQHAEQTANIADMHQQGKMLTEFLESLYRIFHSSIKTLAKFIISLRDIDADAVETTRCDMFRHVAASIISIAEHRVSPSFSALLYGHQDHVVSH